jgi:hypothetical protein
MQSLDAYPVPFRVQRADAPTYRIINVSAEPVHGVALTLHGSGVMGASSPCTLEPLEALEVIVAGRDLARRAIMVVRWFRADGEEYLWRISF